MNKRIENNYEYVKKRYWNLYNDIIDSGILKEGDYSYSFRFDGIRLYSGDHEKDNFGSIAYNNLQVQGLNFNGENAVEIEIGRKGQQYFYKNKGLVKIIDEWFDEVEPIIRRKISEINLNKLRS